MKLRERICYTVVYMQRVAYTTHLYSTAWMLLSSDNCLYSNCDGPLIFFCLAPSSPPSGLTLLPLDFKILTSTWSYYFFCMSRSIRLYGMLCVRSQSITHSLTRQCDKTGYSSRFDVSPCSSHYYIGSIMEWGGANRMAIQQLSCPLVLFLLYIALHVILCCDLNY